MKDPRQYLRKVKIDGLDGVHYFHKIGASKERTGGDKFISIHLAFIELNTGRMVKLEVESLTFVDVPQP